MEIIPTPPPSATARAGCRGTKVVEHCAARGRHSACHLIPGAGQHQQESDDDEGWLARYRASQRAAAADARAPGGAPNPHWTGVGSVTLSRFVVVSGDVLRLVARQAAFYAVAP
jgi:hypothetical protein